MAGLRIGPTAVVAIVAAVFLALSGAFGTGEAPFLVRLGYWFCAIGAGSLIGTTAAEAMQKAGWLRGGLVPTVGLITAAMAAPLTLTSWALSGLIMNQGYSPSRLPEFALPVFAVTLVISTINVLIGMQRHAAAAVTHAEVLAPGQVAKPVRFLERIPRKLRGGDLLALQAEDHYLRLHTTAGSDLILMRLSDAIAELDGVEGAQTHRSWWVAKDAVADVERGDGRAVLKLKDGVEAPVSRTYAKALRDAGWF